MLSLEKVNISDSCMMKLFDILPTIRLSELNISSNPISYFCFEHLTKVIKEEGLSLKTLDISNTKMNDKAGIELFESIIKYSFIENMNISRNPGLGYKFSIHIISILRS